MTLPALSLSLPVAAQLTRIIRTSMVEELDKDYVRTAIGSGLPPIVVVGRNVLRNALINPLTVLGLRVGYLLGGAVVIERSSRLPGMGQLMINARQQRRPRRGAGRRADHRRRLRGREPRSSTSSTCWSTRDSGAPA